MSHFHRSSVRVSFLYLFVALLMLVQANTVSLACYTYRAYRSPKPSGPYIEYRTPTSYPYSYSKNFYVRYSTNFRLDPNAFGTDAGRELNTPMTPMARDGKVHAYFGPNKIGSYQLLNGPGVRLTPGHNLTLSWGGNSTLSYWHNRYDYDWRLVNYWYSYRHRLLSVSCWSAGCSTSGTPPRTYCWSGGCSYNYCYNHQEVYYWTKGSYLRGPLRTGVRSGFPFTVRNGSAPSSPRPPSMLPAGTTFNGSASRGSTSYIRGIKDHVASMYADFDAINHRWYAYSFKQARSFMSDSDAAYVHPLPPNSPTWRVTRSGVWKPTIGDTKVDITFNWSKPSLNSNQERYYIEYGKIFDGEIKMRDVVKMLSNLGFGQVDVPVYMALESAEPKLYLVSTPRLVDGRRVAPAPFTAIDQSHWLSPGSAPGFTSGVTAHPTTERQARGYIREAKTDARGNPLFDGSGRPIPQPKLKYVFTKIFDRNDDDKIDAADKRFFDSAFPNADFNEDGKVCHIDCTDVGYHAFHSFPEAFEELSARIRRAFIANPALLATGTRTFVAVAPVPIPELYHGAARRWGSGTVHKYIQIGWSGNAFSGTFYVSPIGAGSRKFPFSTRTMRYSVSADPGVTGENFLPNLGPRARPTLAELYRKTTLHFPDGTLLGRLKTLVVEAYPKGSFYGKAYGTPSLHAIGDPWGIGKLESIESGHMGQLFIRGDADGNGYFDAKDMAKWGEIQARDGFLLTRVYQHQIGMAPGRAIVTDLNRKFRIIAGGKFSVYPPAGASRLVVKESYNYQFLKPTIWAYDPVGNQFSLGKRFSLESGSADPVRPDPPPYPPTEVKYLPTTIIGPDDIPEDMPQTWRAPGTEYVVIKPDTWTQTWSISPAVAGGTGTGTSFTYEFLVSGKYRVIHTVNYTQRIVHPVTDSLGIIVYYAVTDIPQTRVLVKNVRVYDHTPADFADPKLELRGPGNVATYAPQWAEAAQLRQRDFPSAFKAYSQTRATNLKLVGSPVLVDNEWHHLGNTGQNGKEFIDHNFDLVNADPSEDYDYKTTLEVKFARRVNEISDLNASNIAGADHLEAYSGVLLDQSVTMDIVVKRELPDGTTQIHREISHSPSLSAEGQTNISSARMNDYLVRVGERFVELKTVTLPAEFAWNLPKPTFPDQGYETIVTLSCTRRDYYLDHPSQDSANRTRFGADYSKLNIVGNGTLKYLDRPMKTIWRRRALTVDVTPPTVSLEKFDGLGNMVDAEGTIEGNTVDQTQFKILVTDNHPAYGPNDGLINGGVRRNWYPRMWVQQIDAARNRFTDGAKSGYELPIILPSVSNLLAVANDGDMDESADNLDIERVDGHKFAIVEPSDKELVGTLSQREVLIRTRLSPYIAGKIRYVIEVEDGSRNYTTLSGSFSVIDNKRPNIDIRLATPKYKPLPDDGTLRSIEDIANEPPPGPVTRPFGELRWANASVLDRLQPSKTGLLADWTMQYDQPDQWFDSSGNLLHKFTNSLGLTYQRMIDLDRSPNYDITMNNSSLPHHPHIQLSDADVKAAFDESNLGAPGFAEDEIIVFDVSLRDNILFLQCDSAAPFGQIVAEKNFQSVNYVFTENVTDENNVNYTNELNVSPVTSADDIAPLRLVNDGSTTPLTYVFRGANADTHTGLKNLTSKPMGRNVFYLRVVDLAGNTRDLEIDFPIIPSRFQIRVLESGSEVDRRGID